MMTEVPEYMRAFHTKFLSYDRLSYDSPPTVFILLIEVRLT
jgi:hypothetical protein